MGKLHAFLGKMRFRLVLLAILATTLSAFGQSQYTLTGTVTESGTGLPVVGASVFIENTSFGTVTDFDGNYSFTASLQSGSYNLSFSSLGFSSQKIVIDASGNLTITTDAVLSEDLLSLDEVVVTGTYGFRSQQKSAGKCHFFGQVRRFGRQWRHTN